MAAPVPRLRVEALNEARVRDDGDFVLYWMVAARRPHHNFALQRAVGHARALGRPLVVLEALSCRHPWASDRFHRFILDGMEANRAAFERRAVTYHPWVAPDADAGRGLLEALAARACVVVTDAFPSYFLPAMQEAAAGRLPVLLERVDSNGIVPLAAPDRRWKRAHDFRRWISREGIAHLAEVPRYDPLDGVDLPRLDALPGEVTERWPATRFEDGRWAGDLADLPIDHDVPPVESTTGGWRAAAQRLARFCSEKLHRYGDEARHPDADATSGLSPWLHFGHVSAHEILAAVAEAEDLDPLRWADTSKPDPKNPFPGASEGARAFLDQLITWRELGFNLCHRCEDPTAWESIPGWARETLEEHADDERPHLYDLETLERGETDDPIWNAAERQLVEEGILPNYLRMVWGKRVLEWTPSPQRALEVLIHLNDRHALDGRDPSSYNGIGWILGRFDRAWGPERPVYGKVRYMSSEATRKKLRLSRWLERFGP